MATFIKGILGGFSGKVGTVVGSNWKGKNVLRSLPTRTNREASQAQLDQQEKFAKIMAFMSGLSSLLDTSFKAYANGVSGVNAAVSYNLQNAVIGSASPYEIDYSLALVSRGDLPNAPNAGAVAESANLIRFNWDNNAGVGKAKADDKAILVLYAPALKRSAYLLADAPRSAATESFDASAFSGETVETWLAFINANGNVVSNSFYTGAMEVTP